MCSRSCCPRSVRTASCGEPIRSGTGHRNASSTRSEPFGSRSGCRSGFGYPALSDSAKAKILGVNASRLYDIDLTAVDRPDAGWLPAAQDELGSRLA
jgi:hypothetical protein